MKSISPLRYPGGKASIAGFLEDMLDLNDLSGCSYYEPYAGGAGAALSLLKNNCVSSIFINDADIRIYSFWHSVLNESDRFVDDIFSTPIDIKTWKHQKSICEDPSKHSLYKVGFATFFMNRCNRSGVLVGAGPIGGLLQDGQWRIDVRFNREGLAKRILEISAMKDRICVYNMDAIAFLKSTLPAGLGRKKVFVYLDPPYVNKADRLYMNTYNQKDHSEISCYIMKQKTLNWVMSYDDTPLIHDLYRDAKVSSMPIRYSLQSKRAAKELIIAPQSITLPAIFTERADAIVNDEVNQ